MPHRNRQRGAPGSRPGTQAQETYGSLPFPPAQVGLSAPLVAAGPRNLAHPADFVHGHEGAEDDIESSLRNVQDHAQSFTRWRLWECSYLW